MKHTKFHSVILLFFFIISQTASGQKQYEIEIQFSGIDADKAKIGTLAYEGYGTIPLKKQSTNSIAEIIPLSAKYPIIEISYFSSKHLPSFNRYFLTNQKSKLVVHYDKTSDIVTVDQISGVTSFEDEGLNEFKEFSKTELERREAYAKAYNHDFTTVDSSVENTFLKYDDAVRDKGLQFVKKYPDRLYSTYLFLYSIIRDPRYPVDELVETYNKTLKSCYKDSFEEKLILDKLDRDRLALSKKAPLTDKVFKDLKGSTYSISSFGNKLVLVNIWATWCVPCMEEIPKLKELHAKYKFSMEIISFSIDSDEQIVRDFIKSKDISWINVFDQPEIARAYRADEGVPKVLLLNEKGIIIYSRSANTDPTLDLLDKTLALYAEKQKTNK